MKQKTSHHKPIRTAIITPNLAHYRRNLFRLLDQSLVATFVHYSDPRDYNGISSLRPSEVRAFVPLRNVEIGPFLWQTGAVKMALKAPVDAFIFTGNAKYISTWAASAIARLRGKSVYLWTIGWHRPEKGIKRLVRLTYYRLANKLMVYGDPEMAMAIKHGYAANRIDVIYNSVTDVGDVDIKAIATSGKENAVGAIARLTATKNFHLLLNAVVILKHEGMDLKVIFGGDGPERQNLEAKARALGVRCEFLGAIHSAEDIQDFYRRVKVSVVPSTAGLTTTQSMAHGVPVITDDHTWTQAPEANAIVTGLTGSRYPAGDADALAAEIRRWIELASVIPVNIARQCTDEVNARWSPEVQANRMLLSLGAMRKSLEPDVSGAKL